MMSKVGYAPRFGHSGGYFGKIDGQLYSQQPEMANYAFSDYIGYSQIIIQGFLVRIKKIIIIFGLHLLAVKVELLTITHHFQKPAIQLQSIL